jgi:CheY-like chemotaxis protein
VIKQALPSAGADELSNPGEALRVLVVDDDRDALLTLQVLLRDDGHETRGVTTAAETWTALRDFVPNVILLDIGLPDRNGYDVAREIRSRFGKHPVLIAVTAWNKPSDKMLAEMAGFDHHLGKPYEPQRLLDLLKPFGSELRS